MSIDSTAFIHPLAVVMGDVPYDDDLPDDLYSPAPEQRETEPENGYQKDAESSTPSASS